MSTPLINIFGILTLSPFIFRIRPLANFDKKSPNFGMYLLLTNEGGVIKEGDAVYASIKEDLWKQG